MIGSPGVRHDASRLAPNGGTSVAPRHGRRPSTGVAAISPIATPHGRQPSRCRSKKSRMVDAAESARRCQQVRAVVGDDLDGHAHRAPHAGCLGSEACAEPDRAVGQLLAPPDAGVLHIALIGDEVEDRRRRPIDDQLPAECLHAAPSALEHVAFDADFVGCELSGEATGGSPSAAAVFRTSASPRSRPGSRPPRTPRRARPVAAQVRPRTGA